MTLRTNSSLKLKIAVEPSNSKQSEWTRAKEDKQHIMIVALGLDHDLYPCMGNKPFDCKVICKNLRNMLNLLNMKGNINISRESNYQKDLVVGYKRD